MKLKAVIVEDEKSSREILSGYLEKYCPDVELCGMADSVEPGLKLIKTHKPHIVFLDIEMPFGNGFDLLDQVGEINFEIVFTTAFSNYALKAIQVSASHYLLKPINIDELIEAVESAKNNLKKENQYLSSKVLVENIRLENQQLHKIVLPTMEGFEVVSIKNIVHCTADDNFTSFRLQDGSKKLICRSLKYYQSLLQDFDFLRVHKSHLINKHYVSKYRKGKGGVAVMQNGDEIEISITRKKEFLQAFDNMR
jgi:two-component system LytT family response regulator